MAKSAHRSGEAAAAREAAHQQRSVWRVLLAVALLGAWAFVTGSFLSFDPADPPTHTVWPPNSPVRNWCGLVGAWLSYQGFKLLGMGVWIPLAGVGFYVLRSLAGRRVPAASLRLVGLLMVGAAAAGLQSLLAPTSGHFPDLAGGLIGRAGVDELMTRFGLVGTLAWLALLATVGAIVAFDKWVLIVPGWAFARAKPVAKVAAQAAGATATQATRAGSGLITGLAPLVKGREPIRIRLDDLEDAEEEESKPRRAAKRTRKAVAQAEEPEDAADEVAEEDEAEETESAKAEPRRGRRKKAAAAAPEPVEAEEDEDDEPVAEAEEAEAADAEEEEEDDTPGAPQVFDKDQLRNKIAQLPIVFGHQTRKVATEGDLAALQGAGEMTDEIAGYRFPGLDLLENPEENFSARLEEYVRGQAEALESALKQYKIDGEVDGIESGPVITLFHVKLAPGTKVAQLQAISSDVARALKAINIRIVPNMIGRDTVGIEVPNTTKEKVRLKELMGKSELFSKMKLPMFLGKDASGEPLIADLTQMPHMLIAGTTGSGKSVCMNTIIMGFLYTKKPSELKLVLVDPKMVEMSQFKDIPHLMCPVVTEMAKAAAILEWAVQKMDERYELLAEAGCRDIAAYNDLPWDELKERFNVATDEEAARIPRKLPYMVFIIDELADLMMTNKEVEGSIIRIAQKARAVGIHLILATQRPQANVVTGLIKSNMPCRVAFKVASGMDSRIVLDQKGGELLLGQGDMLYLSPRTSKLMRAQGTLVDDHEIRKVVKFMRDVAKPSFERQLVQIRSGNLTPDEERLLQSKNNSSASLAAAREDPLFFRAVEIVLETKRGSVSLLQRRLAIGYTRASRLIDLMGIAGIISDHKGSVARDVLISLEEWEAICAQVREDAKAQGLQGSLFGDETDGIAPDAAAGEDGDAEPSDELDEEDAEEDEDAEAEDLADDADEEDEDSEDEDDEAFDEDDDEVMSDEEDAAAERAPF